MSEATEDVIYVRTLERPLSHQEEQPSQRERSRNICPTLERRLADYQSHVDQAKITLPVVADEATANGSNRKERVSPKVGELYLTHHEPSQCWLVVLRLPLRDLPSVGITGTLKSLGLFKNAPSYVVLDVDSDQHQWKDGYGDGETSSHLRKVPVAYLTSLNSPERIAAEWIAEEDLHTVGADWNTKFGPIFNFKLPATKSPPFDIVDSLPLATLWSRMRSGVFDPKRLLEYCRNFGLGGCPD
ncbi:hypothetical protein FOCG_17430 [Fusarium oxysporum f. sp. radicis-lycopersici 26381]|nr:hypothetical protein FOCG_17430 [Fusarium oxysporum f. sp. radicis-lycopersici 26381]